MAVPCAQSMPNFWASFFRFSVAASRIAYTAAKRTSKQMSEHGTGLQPQHLQWFNTHTHTHPFNGPFSGTTRVCRYQKGKTNLDFTEARNSEWQWHLLGHMHVCTSLQADNHTSTPPLSFLQAGCPSCHPTNSVKALKGCLPPFNSFINSSYILSQCCSCHQTSSSHIH